MTFWALDWAIFGTQFGALGVLICGFLFGLGWHLAAWLIRKVLPG